LATDEALVQKDFKYGIIKRNDNGIWEEMLSCEYNHPPKSGIE
jgi:hypothetical protein